MSIVITEPGIYDGLTNREYHADPVPSGSISVSGAKKLLAPSTPAHYKWERDHPVHKDIFDFGTVAHSMVLEGNAGNILVVEANDWRTKAAQESKSQARADGKTPLLEHEFAQVEAMAEQIKAHPIASALFSGGKAEQSAFWPDKATGIWRRARFDYLPEMESGRRLVIPDYKTCVSADTDKFAKSAADYRYHMQAAWYSDAILEMGLHDDVAFVFVAQEKTAPYAVNVIELDVTAMRIARELNRYAIRIFQECTAADTWPQYQGINFASLPMWAEYEAEGILNHA